MKTIRIFLSIILIFYSIFTVLQIIDWVKRFGIGKLLDLGLYLPATIVILVSLLGVILILRSSTFLLQISSIIYGIIVIIPLLLFCYSSYSVSGEWEGKLVSLVAAFLGLAIFVLLIIPIQFYKKTWIRRVGHLLSIMLFLVFLADVFIWFIGINDLLSSKRGEFYDMGVIFVFSGFIISFPFLFIFLKSQKALEEIKEEKTASHSE